MAIAETLSEIKPAAGGLSHQAAAAPRRGGRPSRLQEAQIGDHILDVATALFLQDGYGATTIEAIAKRAGISKRTFYHRFRDKSELFGAVVHRLVARLRPRDESHLFDGGSFAEILHRLAALILHAALSPEALALHRVILAEAVRFPELATALDNQGARQEALRGIAGILDREAGRPGGEASLLAAEQFLQLVVSGPQRRALGLGTPMSAAELDHWTRRAVTVFLHGYRS